MHPKNIHNAPYDFKDLVAAYSALSAYVIVGKSGKETINFFDDQAVLALNKALLMHHYGIKYWEIPPDYLCPPIPGRADYILHVVDLLSRDLGRKLPKTNAITCLDIGTGANLVYPLLGTRMQSWKFVASEMDQTAFMNAKKIVKENDLYDQIELRKQKDSTCYFKSIIKENEMYTLSFCNPPFYGSIAEARTASNRKLQNLKSETTKSNFGGQANEMWCAGGEKQFIKNMIIESQSYKHQCLWFTSLVSKEKNLNTLQKFLDSTPEVAYKTLAMNHGNKKSRILAWTFFTPSQREKYLDLLSVS